MLCLVQVLEDNFLVCVDNPLDVSQGHIEFFSQPIEGVAINKPLDQDCPVSVRMDMFIYQGGDFAI